jgi:hypothetical protein
MPPSSMIIASIPNEIIEIRMKNDAKWSLYWVKCQSGGKSIKESAAQEPLTIVNTSTTPL